MNELDGRNKSAILCWRGGLLRLGDRCHAQNEIGQSRRRIEPA
jgi:hypothetical protein